MSQKRLATGHVVEAMSEEWLAKMGEDQVLYNHGVVRILPDGWLYPGTAPTFLDKIQGFQFRPDDVVVMTFPKAGTTWMQEVLWTMFNNPNLDNPKAGEGLLTRSVEISLDMTFDSKRFKEMNLASLFEAFKQLCPGKDEEDGVCLQILEAMPGRRVIKCHYPLDLMPPDILEKTKVVYVARNPKDLVVSLYYFFRVFRGYDYQGPLEKFVRAFMNSELLFSPYWPHMKQAWLKRDHANLHFVYYEDLKADFAVELNKLDDFLSTNLTEQQLQNVAQNSTFSSMKSRGEPVSDEGAFNKDRQQKYGAFFRKGTTGDWKSHFSADLNQELDEWIQDNIGESGITFKWGD